MDISELRSRKAVFILAVNKALQDEIDSFKKDTGVSVTSMSVSISRSCEIGGDDTYIAQVSSFDTNL